MRYGICIWALLFLSVLGGSLTGAVNHANRSGPLRVAILWFDNEYGDESLWHWQEGIGLLLDKQLRECKSLRMVSSSGVDFGCRQLSIRNGDPIDAAIARKMGEFVEAQRVIWGSFHRKDGVWHVSLYVLTSASGQVSKRLRATSGNWFDICDQLRTQIIKDLGITPSDAEKAKMSRRWTISQVTLEMYTKAYLREKNGLEVTDELERALAADPNCADVYGAIGATSGTRGDFDKAKKFILRALELKPDDTSSHRLLGVLYLLQDDFDNGLAKLKEALSIDGNCVETLVRLGEVSSIQNKHDEAISFFERAVRLDPMNADVHAGLALTYAMGRQRAEAVRHLKKAERIAPQGWNKINAEQKISMTYLMIGDLRKALQHHIEFVTLAEKIGAGQRELIEGFKDRIVQLEKMLEPMYIEATEPKFYTEESLEEVLEEKLTGEELKLVENPIKATNAVKLWAHELTKNSRSDMDKARAIFDCLSGRIQTKSGFGSRTAEEVFLAWEDSEIPFNCQEFTKLYLALAREVNIRTFSVYVSKLYNGKSQAHMCAAVFAQGKVLLADPLNHWFGVPHEEYVILDDLENFAFHLSQSKGSAADRIARYRIAIKLCPDNYIALVNLVDALADVNEWGQAREVLDRALKLEPDHWQGQLALGGFAEHYGHYDTAESYCRKSLELNPEFSKTHCFLGGLLARRGKLAQARDQLRTSLLYQPDPDTEKGALEAIAKINELIGSDEVVLTKR